jgi:hypothetical protein
MLGHTRGAGKHSPRTRHYGRAVVDDQDPPSVVRLSLDEGLGLLADLEDARDGLIQTNLLAVVVGLERNIQLLSHRLGFDDPEGDADVG